MNFFKKIFCLSFLLLAFCSLYAQTGNKDYEVVKYSADDNYLPQNSVKSIVKDNNGFIWMTTENGLVRYDGSKFDVFNMENIKGINCSRMSLFRGSVVKDSIYLQTEFSEYILIKNNKVSFIPPKNIPSNFAINKTIFSKKRLFADKIHKTDNSYYSLENDLIKYYSSDNKLEWSVPFVYDRLTNFFLYENELYVIDNKEILKITKNKIIAYKNSKIIDKQSKILINYVMQQTFVIKGSSVYIIARNKNGFYLKTVLNNYDLSASNIISAFYDKQNNLLYLGSATSGLLVVKEKTFTTVSGSGANRVYYAQVPLGSDQFLASSGEVFSTNPLLTKPVIQLYDKKYSDLYILVMDKNGDIWTKTDNNVYKFYKQTNYKTYKEYNFKDRISIIYELKNGQILVGTGANDQINGKLYSNDLSVKNTAFTELMSLKFIPTCLLETENNVLYAGSNVGFHKINISIKKYLSFKNLANRTVRGLFSITANEIWITTYDKGFFLYNTSTTVITKFPLDKNKYLSSSHSIVDDLKGYFWISTNKGLFQVSKQNLIDYASKKTKSVYYHYYDKSEGFATNEFNGGCHPSGLLLKNSFITFPSMNGIVLFNSDKVVPKMPVSGIFFEQAKVDDKVIPVINNNLTVKQGFEILGIYIHSPYYGSANNVNIEVKFDGPITQKWRLIEDNYISFTTLPPGTYFLTARKLSGFNAQYQYKKLKITIPKLFHQTFLFYFIIFLLVLALIGYSIILRTQYIRKANILLENKIAEQTFQLRNTIKTLKNIKDSLKFEIASHKKLIAAITHDIKSPLRFLVLTGKHLYKNKENNKAIQEDIENVYSSSNQLYNFVDNLLEYAKVSDDGTLSQPYNLSDLVNEKINFFKNIATSKKTIILNLVNEKETLTINRQLLSIIIHNILDNSIKNTSAGKIEFSVIKDLDEFLLIIQDSGAGMSPELVAFYNNRTFLKGKKPKKIGLGLQMIAELVDIIKGKIIIESALNEGTKIIILFKI